MVTSIELLNKIKTVSKCVCFIMFKIKACPAFYRGRAKILNRSIPKYSRIYNLSNNAEIGHYGQTLNNYCITILKLRKSATADKPHKPRLK